MRRKVFEAKYKEITFGCINDSSDGSKLFVVGLWPGYGYFLSTALVWANDASEAIDIMADWASRNAKGLTISDKSVQETREDILVDLAREGKFDLGVSVEELEDMDSDDIIKLAKNKGEDAYFDMLIRCEEEPQYYESIYPCDSGLYVQAENLLVDEVNPDDYAEYLDTEEANESCCNESLNGSFAEWDSLMHECIEVESARDAKSFFDDVEKLAGRLGFKCVSGKAFSASDAMKEWNYIEDKVQREIDSLIDKYGEGIDDLPLIGLKYFMHDDTLAIGIYDRGNFDAMAGWEFCNTPSCKNEAMFSGKSILNDIFTYLQNNGPARIHVYNNGKGGDGKLFVKVAYDGNNVYFTTDDDEKVLAKYVPSKVLLDAFRAIDG